MQLNINPKNVWIHASYMKKGKNGILQQVVSESHCNRFHCINTWTLIQTYYNFCYQHITSLNLVIAFFYSTYYSNIKILPNMYRAWFPTITCLFVFSLIPCVNSECQTEMWYELLKWNINFGPQVILDGMNFLINHKWNFTVRWAWS